MARALQRHLHRLGRRWYRPAALRVFRDDATLTASPDLWAAIERALVASRTLVLLAGPAAAASPWVDRELEWWRAHRAADSLFIVVTGGEVAWDAETNDFDWERATALPPRLRGWFGAEPLWVDLRGHQDKAELRSNAASVAAAVHGVPKDRLLSDDLQRQRQLITVLSTLLLAALVAAGAAVRQHGVALDERDRADHQARVAISRALAAEAENRSTTDPQLASQFAVAAFDAAATPEAKGAVARQFDRDRHVTVYVHRGGDQSRGSVSSAALTADGSLLVYVVYGEPFSEADVVLWDTRTKSEVGRLPVRQPSDSPEGLELTTASVAVDASGRLLAVDDGGRIQVWDVPGRRLLRTLGTDDNTRLVMSPDGQWIARAVRQDSDEGKVEMLRVWRSDTGTEVSGAATRPLSVDEIGFTADNQLYALPGGWLRGELMRFDPSAGQWSKPPLPAAVPAWHLAVSRRGSIVATATSKDPAGPAGNMVVTTWNLATGSSAKRDVPASIESLTVSDDGETVVFATDRRLFGVEMSTGLLTDLAHHRDDVKAVSMADDGGSLVSVDRRDDVWLSARSDSRAPTTAAARGQRRADTVYALTAGRRGDLATVARGDGDVELWELPQLKLRLRLPVAERVSSLNPQVALSDDSSRMAAVIDGALTVADTRSGQVLPGLSSLTGRKVVQARFGANGRLLVTTFDESQYDEQVLRVINLENGAEEQTVPLKVNNVADGSALAVSDGGELVAAIIAYSEVTLWRWRGAGYEEFARIDDGSNMIYDVAMDPAGTRVAFAEQGGRVVVAEVDAPQQRRVLPVANGGTQVRGLRLAFTSDGSTLVQASHSFGNFGGIALVDPVSGVLLATWLDDRALADGQMLVGGARNVVAERSAGNTVLGASLDGRLLVWQVDIDAMRRRLCELAGPLPPDQRDRYFGGVPIGPGCGR